MDGGERTRSRRHARQGSQHSSSQKQCLDQHNLLTRGQSQFAFLQKNQSRENLKLDTGGLSDARVNAATATAPPTGSCQSLNEEFDLAKDFDDPLSGTDDASKINIEESKGVENARNSDDALKEVNESVSSPSSPIIDSLQSETFPDEDVIPIDFDQLPLSHPLHPQHTILIPAPNIRFWIRLLPKSLPLFRSQRLVVQLIKGGNLCSWVYCSLVVLVASVVYWNALGCGFVFDDISAIKENRDLRPHTPISNLFLHDFWGTPMQKEQSHKSYRPLCVLTFRLNYLVHALQPMGYHLVNVMLHAVVCGLYYRMCSLFLPELSSFIAALLFAVHPVHTEAVTGVVGRAETLSSIFFIGSLLAYSAATRKLLQRSYMFSSHNNSPVILYSSASSASAQPSSVAATQASAQSCSSSAGVSQQNSVLVSGSGGGSYVTSSSVASSATNNCRHYNNNSSNRNGYTSNGYSVLSSVNNGLGMGCMSGCGVSSMPGVRSYGGGGRSYYRSSSGGRSGSGGTQWGWLLVCVVMASCAMLCKEQGITVMAVCALYELVVVQKVRGWDLVHFGEGLLSGKGSVPAWLSDCAPRVFALVATTLGLMLARVHIMGAQLPVFTRFDNPASVAETPIRQLTYNYLVSVNTGLLLMPATLCCDWTMGTVPLITSFLDPRNLFTVATYATLAKLAHYALFCAPRQHAQALLMGLGFLVLPFLPASNLFFPVGFVVAERVLYMPSMGYCLIVAHGFTNLLHRASNKRSVWLGLLFLLSVHSLKTHLRNADWKDEYTVFTAGLKVNQRNAKLFNNVGHALESEGRFGEALNYFQVAVAVQEDDIGAHINVGRTYNNLKRYIDAEDAYLKAKSLLPKAKPGESYQARIAPNHLNVFLNLANLIARNSTRLEEADALYRQAISMRADYTQAYINRGDILIKMNRTKEAQEVYERALFYDSTNPDIYYNLGVVLLERGRAQQALAYLDKALEMDPDHQQALLNSAVLIQESGNAALRPVAVARLLRLVQKEPSNERVYFNLGMIAMDDHDYKSAEKWFRKAVELKEDFRSALFNLALLLTDDGRPLEAAPFLNQLVKHHPDHVKGLILLGDIYINNIKDLDAAEKCYERILSVDPGNIQGLHNLCVVYVERGELSAAETCLAHAHTVAPTEDYILRHLNIVKNRMAKYAQQQQAVGQQQSSTASDSGAASDASGAASDQQEHMPEFQEPSQTQHNQDHSARIQQHKQQLSSKSNIASNDNNNNPHRTKNSDSNSDTENINRNKNSKKVDSENTRRKARRDVNDKDTSTY